MKQWTRCKDKKIINYHKKCTATMTNLEESFCGVTAEVLTKMAESKSLHVVFFFFFFFFFWFFFFFFFFCFVLVFFFAFHCIIKGITTP